MEVSPTVQLFLFLSAAVAVGVLVARAVEGLTVGMLKDERERVGEDMRRWGEEQEEERRRKEAEED